MKKRSSLLDYSYPGLSADIWQADGTLLPYHKDYILKLITSFYETYKFKEPLAWVKDITNIGSLTTNKYIRTSDFDCHVIVDLKAFQETNMPDASIEEAALYLDNARKEWDRARIPLPFGEHPLELYFESELTPSNTTAVGRYSLMSNTWLKEPVYFAQDLDYEESKRGVVDEAIQLANELDASFGNIRRDIQRIEELKTVAKAWPTNTQKLYMEKIQGKLDAIEAEIEKAISLQQSLIDERHEKQDPFSDNEIKFKYLARFFYFYVISELKDLMKTTDGEVTETELPAIKKIVTEAAKDPQATETDICVDFDHTIAHGAKFPAIGEPIDGAKESLAKLKELGYNVIIYSCRGDSKEGTDLVRDWLDKHDMQYDSIFEGEKPFAKFYIDDRAIRFENWKDVLTQVEKSDKTASLHIAASARYWVDPSGKIYTVERTHAEWILDNTEVLSDQYGLWDNHPEELYREETDNIDAIISMMLRDGWTRVGDLFGSGNRFQGQGIEIADLSNAPSSMFSFVSNFGGEKYFMIEDLRKRFVEDISVADLIQDGQEAINSHLKSNKLVHASMGVKAAGWPAAFWISPNGQKYDALTHDTWMMDNAKLLKQKYNFDLSQYDQDDLFDAVNDLVRSGWARVSVSPNGKDYMAEVADVQNVPTVAIDVLLSSPSNNFLFESPDTREPSQVTREELAGGQEEITRNIKRASLIKNASYTHAYWIDPNGKVFQVRGDDEEAIMKDLDRSNKNTHGAWVLDHLDMLEKEYGIDPKSISGTASSLVELGWTRIGDAFGTDWGITVQDTDNIPSFVDDVIAQFAPEGSIITVATPGSYASNYTFEWPVKSIQQAVQRIKNTRSRVQAPNLELAPASMPLSKRDVKAVFNPYEDESLKQGPAYAIFEHTQKGLPDFNVPDIQMYTILGNHPLFGSTVAEEKLKELGIPIRQQKQAQTKKVKQGEYGAVMALIPHNVAQEIVEWGVRNIPDKDVYDNPDKPRLGRELESHITIKYGLLTEDAKTVRRFFNESKPFKATLGKVRHFEPPEMDFDVVTVEIISEDLDRMNAEVTKEFECAEGLPSDEYHPHITVSYVKRGTGKDYVGSTEFEGNEVELDTIIFSPAKGNRTYFSVSHDKEGEFHIERIRKNAYGPGNWAESAWISPTGEVEEFEGESHEDMIYELMDDAKIYDQDDVLTYAINNGWTRFGEMGGGGETGANVKDIKNINPAVFTHATKYTGQNKQMVVADNSGEYVQMPVDDFVLGQNAVNKAIQQKRMGKQADFLPSVVQAPDNDWQFAGGGDDKEIPVDPSPVSDEQTLMDPCQTGKPRKNQMWKELWHMIKTPFSKKETEAAADPEQENIEKNELGEDETLLEYSKHFKDLNRQDTNKPKTTWDAGPSKAPNQQEPYSPLPVTLDVVTNPDNENWRYPWRFTRRPVGDQSNQGEVTQALEHMLENIASLQKTAGGQSNSVPDYLMDEWKRDQIHDDVDSEPYVTHDQRDYPYGMHDSPENTDSNIGWAKDNEPYVIRLDQLEKPFNRKWAPGLPEYQVFFFDTMPMSDGSEV